MCIQMKRLGAPVIWDTSSLKEVGDKKTFKNAKTRVDSECIRMNGKRAGKKLKIRMGVKGGARVELVSFIKKEEV